MTSIFNFQNELKTELTTDDFEISQTSRGQIKLKDKKPTIVLFYNQRDASEYSNLITEIFDETSKSISVNIFRKCNLEVELEILEIFRKKSRSVPLILIFKDSIAQVYNGIITKIDLLRLWSMVVQN